MTRELANPVLTAAAVRPSQDFLKVDGIFNCGAAKLGEEYILLCRVAESCIEKEEGSICVPVYDDREDCIKKVTVKKEEIGQNRYDTSDSRMIFRRNESGIKKIKYLTSLSHLRIARSRDGVHFTVDPGPALSLQGRYERWGMEDPRITYLEDEGRYCITYTAVSDLGAMPALLITGDFAEFERVGAIFPPENKDVVIFPKKIGGLYYACHRPVPYEIGTPDIWISSSPDLIHWGRHRHVCGVCEKGWENGRVGSGVPPIATPKGWLHIYHGADADNRYCLGLMLTDLNRPWEILAKAEKPVLEPEADYEKEGFFGGVVFACGCVREDSLLKLYYGAADDKIARADISLEEVYRFLGVEQ
ncbi:MAG: glycoside hydrolase family 130 protein [bacterium]|nr:glycoside hydrolase family 130 protein [bacterium]